MIVETRGWGIHGNGKFDWWHETKTIDDNWLMKGETKQKPLFYFQCIGLSRQKTREMLVT